MHAYLQLLNRTTSEECAACGSSRARNPRGIEQAVDGRNRRQGEDRRAEGGGVSVQHETIAVGGMDIHDSVTHDVTRRIYRACLFLTLDVHARLWSI